MALPKKDGTLFWVESACGSPSFGGATYLLSTLRDITRRKQAEEKLMKMARFDLLTGLDNRGVFVADLERAIADARRRGSRVTVLYLDLDHFKDVNDTLGHPVGDRLAAIGGTTARRQRPGIRHGRPFRRRRVRRTDG